MPAWMAVHAFVFWLFVRTISAEAPSTLRMFSVVFRHGDRSPMGTFPGDLHNEFSWPQGFSQLSQEGMRQEYNLGQFFRSRYSGFLNAMYKRSEIHMQSTNKDRTLMSAQMVMAGLYPPQAAQRWNDSIPWQPIPIFAMELASDRLFVYSGAQCPAFGRHWQNAPNDPNVRKVTKKHKELLDLIHNHTGAIIGAGHNGTSFSNVRDTLFCEGRHKKEWPSWVTQEMMSTLGEILPTVMRAQMCGREASRLSGGLILERMISDMKIVTENLTNNNLKALMYSAHDTNILALLCALNIFNDQMVPYSAAVIVELHYGKVSESSSAAEWFVQVWYRNDSTRDPYPLTVPHCSLNCPLHQLINLTRDNIADNWNAECGFFNFNVDSLWRVLVISVATGLGVILVLLLLSCCCHRKCKRRRLRPRPSKYGQLRVVEATSRPEEVPMMSPAGDSDLE